MSLSTMIDAFDTPMADETGDTVMNLSGSSENNVWYQSFSEMDEDGRMHQDELESLEVDMLDNEYDHTIEYEMGSESYLTAPEAELGTSANAAAAPVDTIQDTEVYDASVHPSPLSVHVELEHDQIDAPSSPGTRHVETISRSNSLHADDSSSLPDSHGFLSHLTHSGAHSGHHLAQSNDNGSNGIETVAGAVAMHSVIEPPIESVAMPQHSDQLSVIDLNNAGRGEPGSTEETRDLGDSMPFAHLAPSDIPEAPKENDRKEDGTEQSLEISNVGEATKTEALGGANAHADDSSVLENDQASSVQAPHRSEDEVSGQMVYQQGAEQVSADSPPPISLILQVTSSEGDQPEFALFNLPESTVANTENASLEEPLLLLQHKPSLFYEPISLVFEAFRQEEYFSHLEELSDAEMVLNAYDLQLAISEDNVYAREVSLHDFYAMHQGLGLPGHLRLALQSDISRFISRYNFLRDQLTRQVSAAEPEADSGHEGAEAKSQQGPSPSNESHEVEDHVVIQEHDKSVSKTQVADEIHDYNEDTGREQLIRGDSNAQRSGKDEGSAGETIQVELSEIETLQRDVVGTTAPRRVLKVGEEVFDAPPADGDFHQAGDVVHDEERYRYHADPQQEIEGSDTDDSNKEEAEEAEEVEEDEGSNEIENGDSSPFATTEGISNIFEPAPSRVAAVQASHSATGVPSGFDSSGAERSKLGPKLEYQAIAPYASEQTDPFSHDNLEQYDEGNDAEYDDAYGEDGFEQHDLGDDIQGSSEDTLDDADYADTEEIALKQLDTAVGPRPEHDSFGEEDQDGFHAGGSQEDSSLDNMRRVPSGEFYNRNSAEQTDRAHCDAGHKRSKRRLHDSEEEEVTRLPPDTPESKRARVLRHGEPVS